MKALQLLFKTESSAGPLIARLVLGLVMLPHGLQKTLGWFGGHGFSGTMQFSRVAAFGIATVMAVAIVTVHASNGFFMNWFGAQKGEGFEYHLLAIGLALVVLIQGAGKASLDGLVARSLQLEEPREAVQCP